MKISLSNRTLCTLLAFILVVVPHFARAATTVVTVGGGGNNFNPQFVTIRTGDTVQWTWAGNNHSATSGTPNSPNGIFDSGIHNAGFTFSFTFTTAGVYPYYCRVHGAMMTGTVTVVVATPTPTATATPTLTPTPTATSTPTTPTPDTQPYADAYFLAFFALPARYHRRERVDQYR